MKNTSWRRVDERQETITTPLHYIYEGDDNYAVFKAPDGWKVIHKGRSIQATESTLEEAMRYVEIVCGEDYIDWDSLEEPETDYVHELDDPPSFEEQLHQEMIRVDELKKSVKRYDHDLSLPVLPVMPEWSLHGVGIIYDRDEDDRVLIAIDELKDKRDIVALAEHNGGLTIYTRHPAGLNDEMINVGLDSWHVIEYIPRRGRWIEVNKL
jgi:hypothetical protein